LQITHEDLISYAEEFLAIPKKAQKYGYPKQTDVEFAKFLRLVKKIKPNVIQNFDLTTILRDAGLETTVKRVIPSNEDKIQRLHSEAAQARADIANRAEWNKVLP
jgi:hypothetical protein